MSEISGDMSPDEFLQGVVDEQLKRERHEMVQFESKIDIDRAIDLFQLPTAFRFDDEQKQEKIILADGDMKDRLGSDTFQMTRILSFVTNFREYPNNYEVSKLRKQLMAEMFTHSDYDRNDTRWLEFINMLIPGPGWLDFDNTDDQDIIKRVVDDKRLIDMKKTIFAEVVGKVTNEISDEHNGEIESAVLLTAVKRALGMLSLNEYQVEGAVAEVVRETGLSDTEVNRIVDAVSYYHIASNGNSSPDML